MSETEHKKESAQEELAEGEHVRDSQLGKNVSKEAKGQGD